ncbi:MAG: cytochrome C [Sulfurimonas sp.]|nr:cytochrome C [Sulfurimonas sp.]MBU1216394.1 c-type cytochrome [bacterium]MBU1435162.1 c-type cytochrome [bacterium]MBU1502819.1 c-type cytochrome [bacterium]MBU3937989.1 c-type cytochrome [bacterium]
MTYFKIVLSIAVASLLIGCGEDKTATNSTNTQTVVEQKTEAVTKVVDDATKAAEVVVKEAAQETQTAVAETQNAVADVTKTVDETTKEAVAEIKEAAQEATVKVEESVAPIAAAVEDVVAPATTVSGADLYKACASCHGQNAEKVALGKSQIIKGWDAGKIAEALNGYKDGTYGGAMKNVMKGQASKLSDADITAISEHISKF